MLTLAVMMTTMTTTVLILIFCLIGHCPLLTKLPKTILLTKASSTRFDFFLFFYSGLHCLIFCSVQNKESQLHQQWQRTVVLTLLQCAPVVVVHCSCCLEKKQHLAVNCMIWCWLCYRTAFCIIVLFMFFVFQDGESNVEIHGKEAEGDADKDNEADKSKEMEGDASLVSIENLHLCFIFIFHASFMVRFLSELHSLFV